MAGKVFAVVLLGGIKLLWPQSKLPSQRQLERWSELGFYERIVSSYEAQPHAFGAEKLLLTAEAYFQLGRSRQALQLYQESAHAGTQRWEPRHLLAYARLLHARGEVQRASQYYKLYAETAADPTVASMGLAQVENCQRLSTASTWKVEVVKELLPWAPVYAAWWAGGEQVYAVSRSPQGGSQRDREGFPYERIVPALPGLRYRYHQAVVGSLSPDTLLLYLSRGKGDIYLTVATPQGWSAPKRWERLPFRPRGRVSLCIDPKTQDLYFAQDPGQGRGRDLYRCVYLGGGQYAPAERLSNTINTPYDEDAPFIVEDTFYFASNGPASAGGYDIFYAVRIGEREWSAPVRMPAPINSCANDLYFFPFAPNRTYFSSDREGPMQVYQATRTLPPVATVTPTPETVPVSLPPRSALTGRLYHRDTQKGLAGEIILVDSSSQKEVAGIRTGLQGEFRLYPPEAGGTYYLYAQAPGFMTHVQVLRWPGGSSEALPPIHISLTPIEMEVTFELRNIYFDFNSDRLKAESIPELQRLRRLLQENPNIRIRFSGHTDNIGGDKYNQQLSERRARAVYRWLRDHGIHPIQMEYIGYGKTRPIASNSTEEGRALNRRIEMEVVGIRRFPEDTSASRE